MSIDLADIHEPLTTTFIRSTTGGSRLRKVDIESFSKLGYCYPIKLLDNEQVEALRHAVDNIVRPEFEDDRRFYEYNRNESTDPAMTVFHALGGWRVSPALHDLVFYAPLCEAATLLLGGPVRLWHDQVFIKPARQGGVVAWHQDYSDWVRTKPLAHLTCFIALDDMTLENGCLQYVPGSHRWPLLPRGALASDMDAVLELLSDDQRSAFKPAAVELKAGEASFHHPMTVHGSHPNISDQPRRAAVVNFVLDGVMSDSEEPLLAGVPPIMPGAKLMGKHFPLLT